MGRDRPPGQQQRGGDLWVRQPCLHQRGDLGFGGREAVSPACLQPSHVRSGAERAVDVRCLGERGPGLLAVAGADELPGGRLQRLGLAAAAD